LNGKFNRIIREYCKLRAWDSGDLPRTRASGIMKTGTETQKKEKYE
jgi:hypothetical protein